MSNILFLVQIDETPTFLTALKGGQPYGTSFPTQALSLSFDAATILCHRLNDRGYSAIVVDRFGQPPTAADLMAVKRDLKYIVLFSTYFFVGVNSSGSAQGSRDKSSAQKMSQGAALEIVRKLRRAGHSDASIVEADSEPSVDVESELENIWPSTAA